VNDPPYESTTGLLRRLLGMERGLELLDAILGLDSDVHEWCRGRPSECGERCAKDTCPLRNNRLQHLGSLIDTLLEEFRWHRAWADELEAQGVVSKGSVAQVAQRVRQNRLKEALVEAEEAAQAIQGVQVLRERFASRIDDMKAEIAALDVHLETDDDEGAPS